jgi:hypothetical protein
MSSDNKETLGMTPSNNAQRDESDNLSEDAMLQLAMELSMQSDGHKEVSATIFAGTLSEDDKVDNNAPTIACIGDSTIDNIVWTRAKEASVCFQLEHQLHLTSSERHRVINLAADGFTSSDVLHGAAPLISFRYRAAAHDPFPVAETFESAASGTNGIPVFKPLDALRTLNPAPSCCVLSVGGNDVREVLGNVHQLPATIVRFQQNFTQIIDAIREVCPRIIVMLQYRPSICMDDKVRGTQ